MRARYVSELAEGSRVAASFIVRSREVRAARNGDAYLKLALADRTGVMPAVYFRPPHLAADVPTGTVVHVEGTVTAFRGSRRISVDSMLPAATWDPNDFLSAGPRSICELTEQFTNVVRSISDGQMRELLRGVFGEDGVLARFGECPNAVSGSGAYLGGLIEHTLAVADLCDHIAGCREGIDRSLLVTAALLHDVGRIDEFEWDTTVDSSDRGILLGHVALGLMRVDRSARTAKIDERSILRVEHAILSHHGSATNTSGVAPSTTEAMVLYRADQMDRDTGGFSEALSGAVVAQERWTGTSNIFGRPLFAVASQETEGLPETSGGQDRVARKSA